MSFFKKNKTLAKILSMALVALCLCTMAVPMTAFAAAGDVSATTAFSILRGHAAAEQKIFEVAEDTTAGVTVSTLLHREPGATTDTVISTTDANKVKVVPATTSAAATVTLTKDFLNTLSVGAHTFRAISSVAGATVPTGSITVTVIGELNVPSMHYDKAETPVATHPTTVTVANAADAAVTEVTVAGTKLTADANGYTVSTGAITLAPNYLKTLNVGEYDVTVKYTIGTNTMGITNTSEVITGTFKLYVVDSSTAPAAATLAPAAGTYDLNKAAPENRAALVTTVTSHGRAISKLMLGDKELVSGLAPAGNYVIDGDTITFSPTYLETLAVGEHKVTVQFSDNSKLVYTITIKDTSKEPVVPTTEKVSINPTEGTYDLNKGVEKKALGTTIKLNGRELKEVRLNGKALALGKDYTYTAPTAAGDPTLIFTESLLGSLAKGNYTATMIFDDGSTTDYTIKIVDTTAGAANKTGTLPKTGDVSTIAPCALIMLLGVVAVMLANRKKIWG